MPAAYVIGVSIIQGYNSGNFGISFLNISLIGPKRRSHFTVAMYSYEKVLAASFSNDAIQFEHDMVLIDRNSRSFQTFQTSLKKCRNFCSSCILIVCISLLAMSFLAIIFKPSNNAVHVVYIETKHPILFKTNPKYLSIALDSSVISDAFRGFNMTNDKLIKMTSNLSPGYLRIGGTMADRLLFMSNKFPSFKTHTLTEYNEYLCKEHNICAAQLYPNFTMSGDEWLQLNQFARKVGLRILFDLNVLIRFDNGTWNSENAELLINFSNEHKLDLDWELGNEPMLYREKFNYYVDPEELARNFKKLRTILNKYSRYKSSLLVGPDSNKPSENENENYVKTFLNQTKNVTDIFTWHQYYMNGRKAIISDFVNPHVFDLLQQEIDVVKKVLRLVQLEDKPIWLGETSSAYGGGAPCCSDKFVGSFIWLDKLGLAAKMGIDLVVRQSIVKGYYALLNSDYDPFPDWWISVLYKTFVSSKVVACHVVAPMDVRFYCHCASDSLYTIGPSITVFGMNMKENEVRIRLEMDSMNLNEDKNIYAYMLTAGRHLHSKTIRLNDEILNVDEYGNLPPFKPKVIKMRPYVTMPPYSMVFWIIPNVSNSACAS